MRSMRLITIIFSRWASNPSFDRYWIQQHRQFVKSNQICLRSNQLQTFPVTFQHDWSCSDISSARGRRYVRTGFPRRSLMVQIYFFV